MDRMIIDATGFINGKVDTIRFDVAKCDWNKLCDYIRETLNELGDWIRVSVINVTTGYKMGDIYNR